MWLSHGSETGILVNRETVSWKRFSVWTKTTPGKDIVLACHSEAICDYAGRDVLSIGGTIEAGIGGIAVASILTSDLGLVGAIVERYQSIALGETAPIVLSIQQDWASVRIPAIAVLTGLFFVGAYYVKWHSRSLLLSILGAILTFGVGAVIGYAFQEILEFLRASVGTVLMAINSMVGKTFNAVIGSVIGYVVSAASPFKIPSFISAIQYLLGGSAAALALSDTPDIWVRLAACSAAAIGIIAMIDAIVQLM